MKRTLCLVLVTVMIGAFAFTPAHRAAAATPSLAALMPADTFGFVELRTDNLPNDLKAFEELLNKAGIPPDLLTTFDGTLTQVFRRPASLEKDVFPWLGDRMAVGLYVPDVAIDAMFTRGLYSNTPPTESYFVAAVKDEAAADRFLTEFTSSIIKTGAKLSSKADTIGGNAATLYLDDKGNASFARWKGYLAFGGPSISRLLDTVKNPKATLATDPGYQRIAGMLKPDSLLTAYVRSPISPPGLLLALAALGPSIGSVFEDIVRDLNRTPGPNPTATPTRTPTPTPAPEVFELAATFRNLGESGVGLYGDSKQGSIDFAFHVDPDNLRKLFTLLKVPAQVQLQAPAKPISVKMADRISNKAIFVAIGSDLAALVKDGRSLLKLMAKLVDVMNGNRTDSSANIDAGYAQLELGLKQFFDLDLNQDVLSWLGGEFALVTTYNPNSDMATGSNLPLDQALLVETTDTAKTEAFIGKLNAGIGKMGSASPTQADNGLFSFQANTTTPGVSYGLIKGTFVVTNSSGSTIAANAARGDGTLSSDAGWKEATALLPKTYQHVWYLNMAQLGAILQEMTRQSVSLADRQTMMMVNLFKSIVLYSTDLGGGSSLTTMTFLLK